MLIPKTPRVIFDIKKWLKNDLILIEKDFRGLIKSHNWNQYLGKYVSIQCSNNAIIPDWAFMLVSKSLKELEIENFIGSLEIMEHIIVKKTIDKLDLSSFKDKSIIKQHQLVYEALGDMMKKEIHALSIKTFIPEQWNSKKL